MFNITALPFISDSKRYWSFSIDIEDVENVLPGRLAAITEWFRVYKMPDGKDPNVFAFDGKGTPKDKVDNNNIYMAQPN